MMTRIGTVGVAKTQQGLIISPIRSHRESTANCSAPFHYWLPLLQSIIHLPICSRCSATALFRKQKKSWLKIPSIWTIARADVCAVNMRNFVHVVNLNIYTENQHLLYMYLTPLQTTVPIFTCAISSLFIGCCNKS